MARKRNPNGAGSIWQRKDGRYEARVYVPQPDGTRKRKTVYGATWEECDTKRQELVRRDRQGIPTPTRSAKLSEWLPYWLEQYVEPRRKLSTFDKYESHVRLYLVPLLGTKRLESLSVADVRRFITRVQNAQTAATAKEAHRVLRTALTAAVREELITRNVASLVEPPRVKQREIHPWTLDETLAFLEAARRDPLYAAFVLAVAMGLRRGELVGLRWSDVDLDNRVLHVRQQTQRRRGTLYDDDPKSRRSRVVPMPALCIAPLRWHRLRQREAFAQSGFAWSETGYVFATRNGRPVEPRNVYRSFTRVAAGADLRVVRLHDARHGCATLLTAAGVAPRVIMEILGHSQISITMDVYTHVVHDTQREAISHMDHLLRRRRPAA
ncbi:site-specific integrase [Streptomyces platensis]|uniref:Site-specific integrase n=1 Tax=Streptomyces platensis TaxID=58346 RepID=A0AAE6NJH4_STRPT|nr:site-specific integrase [Streptomyces platensis]OSY44467.1 Tyrosine recombinase XerD [Streptomyces platensis]QEV53063.1 site-specific integrase [Streptomyces platensis]